MQAPHQHDAAWLRLLLELKQMPQEWLHLNGLEDPVWILILVLITMGDTVFFHELRETSLLIPLCTDRLISGCSNQI